MARHITTRAEELLEDILDELKKLNGEEAEEVAIQEPVEQPSTRKKSTKKATPEEE